MRPIDQDLLSAYRAGDLARAQFLLESGADIHIPDIWGCTPFLIAARYGHIALLDLAVQYGANPYHLSYNRYNALHYASVHGKTDAVDHLISVYRFDPNGPNSDGKTALILAAWGGHHDTFSLLIRRGANPHHIDLQGRSALHDAAEAGRLDIVKEIILVYRLNPNQADHEGVTPFLLAAKNGHTAILDFLVQNGVDPLQKDAYGRNALHYASRYGRTSTVSRLIIRYDLDPNSEDALGVTPFILAAESNQLRTMMALVFMGAIPCKTDHEGRNALRYAMDARSYQAMSWLLSVGRIDPNIPDHNGETALAIAIEQKDHQAVSILTRHGALPLIPLHHDGGITAIIDGDASISEILRDRGTSIVL